MVDPEQIDLIDYLAGEAAEGAPGTPPGAMAKKCVRNEHIPTIRALKLDGDCVQNEHTRPFRGVAYNQADAEPTAPARPMSPYRLLVCLATIGWSERELARRTGRLQTTVRRWLAGTSPVPPKIAAYVEILAAFHQAHPAPRARRGLPE